MDIPKGAGFLHASSVAVEGRGLLIRGGSGTGKSSLALDLVTRGAQLISDDITRIDPGPDGWPILTGTGRMEGVIEARGVGLLRVPHANRAPLALVIEMDVPETDRLPPERSAEVAGCQVPCLHRVDNASFPAAIWALMTGGRAR
ncbi:HPr kinase/phosphorylase [Maritimibacter sp. DP1N21-5]|uniref:HPr kinase/phosphorylase n=1 Tax=Maritimibacter sp. DP1N21-5 TaxID=2836867 RepID=UPI001C46D0D4|nr:serine kinase [Maritimibacter sp. DP1N21-5]MBV7407930.1 serine kinase [Maritimibacter sp. DP1N21-5]